MLIFSSYHTGSHQSSVISFTCSFLLPPLLLLPPSPPFSVRSRSISFTFWVLHLLHLTHLPVSRRLCSWSRSPDLLADLLFSHLIGLSSFSLTVLFQITSRQSDFYNIAFRSLDRFFNYSSSLLLLPYLYRSLFSHLSPSLDIPLIYIDDQHRHPLNSRSVRDTVLILARMLSLF